MGSKEAVGSGHIAGLEARGREAADTAGSGSGKGSEGKVSREEVEEKGEGGGDLYEKRVTWEEPLEEADGDMHPHSTTPMPVLCHPS